MCDTYGPAWGYVICVEAKIHSAYECGQPSGCEVFLNYLIRWLNEINKMGRRNGTMKIKSQTKCTEKFAVPADKNGKKSI